LPLSAIRDVGPQWTGVFVECCTHQGRADTLNADRVAHLDLHHSKGFSDGLLKVATHERVVCGASKLFMQHRRGKLRRLSSALEGFTRLSGFAAPPREGQRIGIRRVLYALSDEQWRIDAYLLLWKTADKSGWNEGFERLEGSLLGYEDWENDYHIEHFFRKAKKPDSTP
jgi:hypothetical protein